jgi:hypothetical protein
VKHLILSLLALALAACSAKTADIYGQRELAQPPAPEIPKYAQIPADQIKWITVDGGNGALDFHPEVDILFVVDNSDSMKSAEDNLQRNVDYFAAALRKNKMIDYHIGVTSVWDSSPRYVNNPHNIYKAGELWNVRDSQGNKYPERFVTKDSHDDLLAATLNIGIEPYSEGGPENEEMFSPIDGALHQTGHGDSNEGFFRNSAQLVVVILSDADDSTNSITPEQLAQELFDFKKGHAEKVSAYAALVRASDPDSKKDYGLRIMPQYHPECFTHGKNNGQCQGFGPDRIVNFILAANAAHGSPDQIRQNNLMHLIQKDFGHDLSRIGKDIAVRTLAKTIALPERPRLDDQSGQLMIRVRYGTAASSQVIPQSASAGWTYDADSNSIEIAGDVPYQYQKDAQFMVEMVPVTLNIGN